jgi:hypothetical protein
MSNDEQLLVRRKLVIAVFKFAFFMPVVIRRSLSLNDGTVSANETSVNGLSAICPCLCQEHKSNPEVTAAGLRSYQ